MVKSPIFCIVHNIREKIVLKNQDRYVLDQVGILVTSVDLWLLINDISTRYLNDFHVHIVHIGSSIMNYLLTFY